MAIAGAEVHRPPPTGTFSGVARHHQLLSHPSQDHASSSHLPVDFYTAGLQETPSRWPVGVFDLSIATNCAATELLDRNLRNDSRGQAILPDLSDFLRQRRYDAMKLVLLAFPNDLLL
jgi:hypothetical protein